MAKESIINQIFHCEHACAETVKYDEEGVKLINELTEQDRMILELLKDHEEYKSIFLKYRDTFYSLESMENELFYKEGFRLGFKLAMDIFEN